MKLFLASYSPCVNEVLGKTFLGLLKKPVRENRLLVLAMDTTSDFYRKYLEIDRKWYIKVGFQENNIDILNLKTDNIPSFEDFDVLHIWGGNTFHYLKRIRELNLIPRIREFIERDGVYVGTSAGSELMCPDLDANLTSDVNDIGLTDLMCLGYVDFSILPHWDSFLSLGAEVNLMDYMRYIWNSGKRVIPITDNQAILVFDNEVKIISP
jgi:dipeptidase E